ncbi:metal-dependent hydrolase [Paenibacillus sp. GSMTC-2017]|uniref:metal-dependent hydrolase n=1 Tax=Paenibacillus sp. GSMTC-2017 TaxID=2794350 RepID=UPI0018D7AD63|nr:metal-dependent hydrolase [Paenibacillus sp. GSMTC-2017]MBH5319531.1 metal-dependent hydrolase [Paenibacillus sp. GSMTC-2017]
MFAGHFGLAAGVKAQAPEVPLWALMLGTQLLDVAFIPLLLSGVETIDEHSHGGGYGGLIIHADYTHSLLGAIILAIVAGLLGKRFWGKRAGYILGGVVFSHWILDLVMHRADMPFLPGNIGDLPLIGLGVWEFKGISIALEITLLAIGLIMYLFSTRKRTEGKNRKAAYLASGVMGLLFAFALVTDVLGLF